MEYQAGGKSPITSGGYNAPGFEKLLRRFSAVEGRPSDAGTAGDEELVASRNGEKHSERNAGEQDRKLLPRAVSKQQ
jgi:hypothetical protein